MTTKSHFYLGMYFIRQNICQGSISERASFLLGCVEPDMNPLTYLKGSLHGIWLRGHNYPNRMPYIEKMLRNMQEEEGTESLIFHYRLGKLVHYLTDAFTYPHNPAFEGTLKEHMYYEDMLEQHFLQELKTCTPNPHIWPKSRLYQKIVKNHEKYMQEKPDMAVDIRFVMETVPAIVASLCSEDIANLSRNPHMVSIKIQVLWYGRTFLRRIQGGAL